MPTRQKHRGMHPKDISLFSESQCHNLYAAAIDLAWLLGRGYSENASAKLVGDNFKLTARQRMALLRVVGEPALVNRIRSAEIQKSALEDQNVSIDGMNIIIFSETLLSGGIIFETMDGVFRDIASVHGSYHRVKETPEAIYLLDSVLQSLKIRHADWYLDAPVSNSGRLAKDLYRFAARNQAPWTIHVVHNPDKVLTESPGIIISSDRIVMSRAGRWFNISKEIVKSMNSDDIQLRFIPDLLKKFL